MSPIPPDDLDLARHVRPGDRVVVGQGTAEPLTLTERLVAQKDRLRDVEIFLGPTFSDTFAPERTDGLRFAAYGGMGRTARLARAGRLAILPWHYGALARGFADGRLRADVVMLQLAPPPPGRRPGLGLANDYVAQAARRARVVVAELNPDVPWTHGAELPPDLRLDILVEARRPPLELDPAPVGEPERLIAGHVAPLVPEGATIQVGIGAIPDAILSGLAAHRGLGVHSGIVSDRVLDLVEAGAVDNSRKPFDAGVTVGGCLFGSRRLYRYAHDNPALAVRGPGHTHGLSVLARLPRFVALNSALAVDLTGQVNTEEADGLYLGGVGGALDFARGALASEGGRGIVALRATAKGGGVSRIVPTLSTVTIPRSDVDTIVTEWGVAELRGLTLAERARRLVDIAAPAFREDLARAAHARGRE